MKLKSLFAILAVVAFVFTGCKKKEAQSLSIKGSDTMLNLASAWAEAYMAKNPKVSVSVDGGGSGTGFAALTSGLVDIATASRGIKPDELAGARKKTIAPMEYTVARDAISVIVNLQNPVAELTMEQLAKLYTGQITNWKDVGGPYEKITLLSRENSSGTYAFFQEHVLGNKDYSKSALYMTSSATIVQEVEQNKWAIGYVGLGYLVEAKVKALGVKKDAASPAVEPSEETVKSGTYSIARPLYLYTSGESKGVAKSFIDFVLSEEGQKIAEETGFVTAR